MPGRPPRVTKTEAIVLGHRRLGDADRIVTLLTPAHGKLDAVAKRFVEGAELDRRRGANPVVAQLTAGPDGAQLLLSRLDAVGKGVGHCGCIMPELWQ